LLFISIRSKREFVFFILNFNGFTGYRPSVTKKRYQQKCNPKTGVDCIHYEKLYHDNPSNEINSSEKCKKLVTAAFPGCMNPNHVNGFVCKKLISLVSLFLYITIRKSLLF